MIFYIIAFTRLHCRIIWLHTPFTRHFDCAFTRLHTQLHTPSHGLHTHPPYPLGAFRTPLAGCDALRGRRVALTRAVPETAQSVPDSAGKNNRAVCIFPLDLFCKYDIVWLSEQGDTDMTKQIEIGTFVIVRDGGSFDGMTYQVQNIHDDKATLEVDKDAEWIYVPLSQLDNFKPRKR